VPNAFASAFITVLLLLEPFSNVPTFLSLTEGRTRKERDRIALVGVSVAAIILAAFGAFGEALLAYLKITIEDLQVAGGVVLLVVALQMIRGTEGAVETEGGNVAVVPLGVPFLAGPGTIVALLVLLDEYKGASARFEIAAAVAAALLVIFVLLRFASVIGSHIRPTFSRAITRVVGLLIMAIAVHFIASAIGEWYHNGVL
jgi:multiple antibiotic resistance protein